jgi:hypothetical protein
MPIPINPQQIQIFNGMAKFYRCFIKNFVFIMAPFTKLMRKTKPFYLDHKVLKSLGLYQVKIHRSTNFDTSKLVVGISCAHKCITIGNRCNFDIESNWKI